MPRGVHRWYHRRLQEAEWMDVANDAPPHAKLVHPDFTRWRSNGYLAPCNITLNEPELSRYRQVEAARAKYGPLGYLHLHEFE